VLLLAELLAPSYRPTILDSHTSGSLVVHQRNRDKCSVQHGSRPPRGTPRSRRGRDLPVRPLRLQRQSRPEGPARRALALADPSAAIAAQGDDSEYQLDKLPVLSRVIIEVKNNYVDPHRIDPKGMVVAAVDMVEKTVAEVMVEGTAQTGKLKVTVGSATANSTSARSTASSTSAWSWRDHGFRAEKPGRPPEPARDRVRGTKGLLSTLDPHSVLLEPKFFKEMKLQTRGEFGGLGSSSRCATAT